MKKNPAQSGIVLALGGGGARGLAHIGVLEVLAREGIPVRAVVGTSIGAEIGAFLAVGTPVERMKELACRMDWISTMRLFTPDFGEAGISTGKGIREYLAPYMTDKPIETLAMDYAAIAADLTTGEEVVIRSGDLLDAVRASISLPGLLSPLEKNEQLLIDGGMVNPIPFDVARKLFGGPVLAVQAHASVEQHVAHREQEASEWEKRLQEVLAHPWLRKSPQLEAWFEGFRRMSPPSILEERDLGISSVMNQALLISENMLVQLRMQLSPPDLLLKPDVSTIGSLEFYRAEDTIMAGREAAEAGLEAIHQLYAQSAETAR
jgi:NTE family protein